MPVRRSLVFMTIMVLSLACLIAACSFSTANIKGAKMASDREGTQEAAVFTQDQDFFCIVQLANAPDDTKVKAVWTAVSVEGSDPNTAIDDAEKVTGDATITFDLSNNQPWPLGDYKVDLYLNDKLDRTLTFKVQ